MKQKNFVEIIITVLLVLGLVYVLPMDKISWGKLTFETDKTVMVTGQATDQVKNEVAGFSAGVMVTSEDKDEAVKKVNVAINEIIKELKNFGIKDDDIKTQNLSIYQEEKYIEEKRKSEAGQWRASNNLEIVLRDVSRVSTLADLLASLETTNVNGPRLRLDENNKAENDLFADAVADARAKAEKAAEAAGTELGKVISISEMGASGINPIYGSLMMVEGRGGAGPAAEVELGSSRVSKTVTVVFELK